MKHTSPWSEKHKDFVRAFWAICSAREIADQLGSPFTAKMVGNMARQLMLPKISPAEARRRVQEARTFTPAPKRIPKQKRGRNGSIRVLQRDWGAI